MWGVICGIMLYEWVFIVCKVVNLYFLYEVEMIYWGIFGYVDEVDVVIDEVIDFKMSKFVNLFVWWWDFEVLL